MATGKEIADTLYEHVDRDLSFMHICGTHEASIARHGLRSLLPKRLKIVMGPGCPVCITPQGEIDAALDLAVKAARSPPMVTCSGYPAVQAPLNPAAAMSESSRESTRQSRLQNRPTRKWSLSLSGSKPPHPPLLPPSWHHPPKTSASSPVTVWSRRP